jgi:hypothetical protein
LIDGVGPVSGKAGRPRRRAERLLADRGYDHDKYRRELRKRGVKPVIARRGSDHGSGLGKDRWVVERTFAWLHNNAVLIDRVGLLRLHGAAVLPAIAEIEDIPELLTRLDLFGDLQFGVIQPHQLRAERVVRIADLPAITQLEGMQVRQVPARERRIDRLGELLKEMRRADQENPGQATDRTPLHARQASPP